MPVQLQYGSPEEELYQKGSVMAPEPSTFRRLQDLLFGKTFKDQWTNALTTPMGQLIGQNQLAKGLLELTKEHLNPTYWKAANAIGPRARGPIQDATPAMANAPFHAPTEHGEWLDFVKENWMGNLEEGKASRGIMNTGSKPYAIISPVAPDPVGTAIHETSHFGTSQFRPSTMRMLENSFRRRYPELIQVTQDTGDTYAENHLNNLLHKQGDLTSSVHEILARMMQGTLPATGPERHLLSKYGRKAAATTLEDAMDQTRGTFGLLNYLQGD